MPAEREVLERCTTARGELQLQRRGPHYELISNGVFLMATYNRESARLVVTAALDAARGQDRVLIGGLGVGISLGAALAEPGVGHVTVVEIEERVIAWNRTYLAPCSNFGLADPRVQVVHADLLRWLQATHAAGETFDAICLDIDNGPDWTVTEANRALYGDASLATLRRWLAPGGAMAVWSASTSAPFATRLARHFSRVRTLAVEQERGEPDYVYLASDN